MPKTVTTATPALPAHKLKKLRQLNDTLEACFPYPDPNDDFDPFRADAQRALIAYIGAIKAGTAD